MISIAITGIAGRMGKTIAGIVEENPETKLSGALEVSGSNAIGKDASLITGVGTEGVIVTDSMEDAFVGCDAIIDFSAPEASIKNLEFAADSGSAIVIGTTGLSVQHRDRIKELSNDARVVFAPNMSVGVNLLFKLIAEAAKALGDEYDIEIVEAHHRHKVDAPSGTALRAAEVAATALGRDIDKVAIYGRQGIIGERKSQEIGIHSVRAGDIVGDHTVTFAAPGERIELTHKAHSRSTFAAGSVRAALWLADKPNGLYDMHDVLGFK